MPELRSHSVIGALRKWKKMEKSGLRGLLVWNDKWALTDRSVFVNSVSFHFQNFEKCMKHITSVFGGTELLKQSSVWPLYWSNVYASPMFVLSYVCIVWHLYCPTLENATFVSQSLFRYQLHFYNNVEYYKKNRFRGSFVDWGFSDDPGIADPFHFFRIRIHGSGFLNPDLDLDQGDPKKTGSDRIWIWILFRYVFDV